jgi:hypothetical protein
MPQWWCHRAAPRRAAARSAAKTADARARENSRTPRPNSSRASHHGLPASRPALVRPRYGGCCASHWRCVMATAVQDEHPAAPCRWPTREEVEAKLRDARQAVTSVRHSAEDLAAETASTVRRHPLRSVGAAMLAGAVAGSVVGMGAGFFMRPRRRRWEW